MTQSKFSESELMPMPSAENVNGYTRSVNDLYRVMQELKVPSEYSNEIYLKMLEKEQNYKSTNLYDKL